MNEAILLLGSDAGIRNAIARSLEAEGYCILGADDLGAAVDLLRKHRFRLAYRPSLFGECFRSRCRHLLAEGISRTSSSDYLPDSLETLTLRPPRRCRVSLLSQSPCCGRR